MKPRPGSPRSLRRRAAFPLSLVAIVSACGLGASACGSDDSNGGAGGAVGTGGTVDSGSGETSVGDARGGSAGMGGAGGTATGGAAGSDASAGSGGARPDAAPEAAADVASDVVLPCIIDGGAASGDCCPDDPNKTQPGVCGCGVLDIDNDGDGRLDCLDGCPGDVNKFEPGICGCGVSDTLDTDGDHTPDCIDLCPKDVDRVRPGTCGCGVPDNTPFCLVHRYSFDDRLVTDGSSGDAGRSDAEAGAGEAGIAGTTVVSDSVGDADGTAVNVVLTGTGSVTLAGGVSDQYIQLPKGIISALGDNATFEAWVSWTGVGGAWQRIFDFGRSDAVDGLQGTGQEWIFLTPLSGGGVLLASLLTQPPINPVDQAVSMSFLPPTTTTTMRMVAVVVQAPTGDAGAGGSLSLYVDGLLNTTSPLNNRLHTLRDVNNWLGRSQFMADPEFTGTYYEFRIYSRARTAAEILLDAQMGVNNVQ